MSSGYQQTEPIELPVSEEVYAAIDAAIQRREMVSIVIRSVESGRSVVIVTPSNE